MDALTEALRVARYTDIVELQVEQNDETVYLAASLDANNGGIQWLPIDPSQRLARHLQTKQWILPMLNDDARNKYYQEAIQNATTLLKSRLGAAADDEDDDDSKTIRILDIGTGSGLLSLMAARHLTRSQITSLEMSTSMADLARLVIAANRKHLGVDNHIQVLTQHSTAHEIMPAARARANLCVSELLESGLLGEGVIPALRDAWGRLLEPDAIMIPQGARVYVAAVQGAWVTNLFGPRTQQANDDEEVIDSTNISLALDPHGRQHMLDAESVAYPVQAQHVFQGANTVDCCILTDAQQAVEISFRRDSMLLGQTSASNAQVTLLCHQPGTIHGILVWWKLDLWDGLSYSLEPGAEPFQDHWKPCVHPLPECIPVSAGDTVTLQVSHNESRVLVKVVRDAADNLVAGDAKRQRTLDNNNDSTQHGQPLVSPERAMQLNEPERLAFFTQGIAKALAMKGKDASVLDLSDFSLCACIAARVCGAKHVVSLESGSGDIPMTSARMCQLGNGLPQDGASFEILQCHAEQLSVDLVGGKVIDIVVAEPYYQVLEGWHLQEALNYYCLIRALRRRNILSNDFVSVPSSCRIMACAIESRQLRSAYRPCGSGDSTDQLVCGFDHTAINQHGANFVSHDLSLPMWQYEHDRITAGVELGRLDFCEPIEDPLEWNVSLPVTKAGSFDAVLIWLEYSCGESLPVYTTGNMSCRQCVRRMNQSRCVDASNAIKISMSLLKGSDSYAEFSVQVQ